MSKALLNIEIFLNDILKIKFIKNIIYSPFLQGL